jgi:hypothetical protein
MVGVILDERDQAHLATALRTKHWINVPGFLDQFAPGAGGDFPGSYRLWLGDFGITRSRLARRSSPTNGFRPLAAGFVAVVAVVFDCLRAFVGDVLGDGGEEVGGGEHLEVALG